MAGSENTSLPSAMALSKVNHRLAFALCLVEGQYGLNDEDFYHQQEESCAALPHNTLSTAGER